MDLSFVPLASEDIEALLGLMREYYALDHLDYRESRAREAVHAMLDDTRNGRIWLVSVDGATAGYCVLGMAFSLEFQGQTAFVDELYLREGYRGKGVGKQVLAFIADECRRLGLHAVRLEVECQNERARRVYEKAGFRRHDRYIMTRWLRGDDDRESSV